jgi:hypothetical protein
VIVIGWQQLPDLACLAYLLGSLLFRWPGPLRPWARLRWRIWQADREVRAVTRSEQARYLALAKVKIERRRQRQLELARRDWRLGLGRWAVTMLPAEGRLAVAVQSATWFTVREDQRRDHRQGVLEDREARRRRLKMREQGQIVLITGNGIDDWVIAYSLRGAALAGIVPCSPGAIQQRRKRLRSLFPEPIHKEDGTDWFLAEELVRFWHEHGPPGARTLVPAPTASAIQARFDALDDRAVVPVALASKLAARTSARVTRTRVPGATRVRGTRNPSPVAPVDQSRPGTWQQRALDRALSRERARNRGELPPLRITAYGD